MSRHSDNQVPKLSDGQHNAENQRSLPDVVGTKKQVSYKTEIIGGVPIVTQTQVKLIGGLSRVEELHFTDPKLGNCTENNLKNKLYRQYKRHSGQSEYNIYPSQNLGPSETLYLDCNCDQSHIVHQPLSFTNFTF